MNKFLFSLVLCIASLTMQAQDAQQWSLFSKVTATWCPNCGSWGWAMMEQTQDALVDKNAFTWTIHYSGDLQNPTAQDLRNNLGSNGQPVFYLNDDNIGALSSNYPSKVGEVSETVDLLSSLGAFVDVQVSATYDDMLNVEVELEFVEDVMGEYYLGVYLVENNVIANQANQGPMTSHPNVVRRSFFGDTFGPQIAIDPLKGFTISDNFTEDLALGPDDEVEDFSVVAIVWNLNVNDQYRMFNLGVAQVSETSSNTDLELESKFDLSTNGNQIQINTENNIAYTLNVYDLLGKQIHSSALNGISEISVPTNSSSIYLVEILHEGKRMGKKVFLK